MNFLRSVTLACLILMSHSALSSLDPVRVGIDLWPGYYPIILAKQLGYFEQQGLEVDIVLPEETDNMLDDFVAGKLNMVCVAMGDAFSLSKKDPGLRVVMITDESSGGDALLAKPGLTSLKGKTLGTNLDGFGLLFINAFLESKGLKRSDVRLVHQEASDAMSFLNEGKADVVHTWEPYVTEAVSFRAGEKIFDSSQTPGLIPDSLLANGKFIKQHPDRIRRFIRAWLKASAWWLKNRHKGDALIEPELLLLPDTINLEGVRLYTAKQNHETFKPGNNMKSLYFVTQHYIDFFTQKGLLDIGMTPEDILEPSFLPEK